MNSLVPYIWAAGVVQLCIAIANLFAPRKLQYRENLAKVSTIVGQIFRVYSVYITLMVVLLAVLSFFFAPELAGGSKLGRFLCAFIAVFWTLRVFIQLFYYDPEVKRRNPGFNLLFTGAFLYLAIVFIVVALRGGSAGEMSGGVTLPHSTLATAFSVALWLAGIGHFVVLIASFQVPARMKWKEDLAKLMPANRKLMWTYGAFIVMTIIAFGTLTLVLHDEFLAGNRAALGLAAFIGVFWLLRLVIDFTYHSHADWPQGTRFVVAHVLLTSLFIALTVTYLGLVTWHVCIR